MLKLRLGAFVALWFVAASSANAGTSIAPFTMKVKSKIYTFAYPTVSGGTWSCAACYVPTAIFSSAGTTGGGLYFYGPAFSEPRTVAHPTPTSGYYFNPYWGAHHSPGITSPGGAHPGTVLSPAVATLTGTGNGQAGPNFGVAPAQPGLVGIYGSLSITAWFGNYRGISSNFLATNHQFNLASGAGPGSHTYTAVAAAGSRGKVKFFKGGDHANGFGGTLKWLGGNFGSKLFARSSSMGGSACTGSATNCFYRLPSTSPSTPPWLAMARTPGLSRRTSTGCGSSMAVRPRPAIRVERLPRTLRRTPRRREP